MKDKSLPQPVPGEQTTEPLSGAERLVDSLRPYGAFIALGVALLFLAFIAVAWSIKVRFDQQERPWMALNQKIAEFGLTGNTSGLKEVAEDFPDGAAGLWGLQLAGDLDLRNGNAQLPVDRTAGIKLIEKARDTLKKIVDAPAASKSTMLQRCSTFSLAYAYESLGDFENAKKIYQQIVDSTPQSALADPARRGIVRSSDPAYAIVYAKFKDWVDPMADAPGPAVPSRPDISFPDVNAPAVPTGGGGEFGEATKTSADAKPLVGQPDAAPEIVPESPKPAADQPESGDAPQEVAPSAAEPAVTPTTEPAAAPAKEAGSELPKDDAPSSEPKSDGQ